MQHVSGNGSLLAVSQVSEQHLPSCRAAGTPERQTLAKQWSVWCVEVKLWSAADHSQVDVSQTIKGKTVSSPEIGKTGKKWKAMLLGGGRSCRELVMGRTEQLAAGTF